MELLLTSAPKITGRARARRLRSMMLSVVVNAALVGGLWSAHYGPRFEFHLAGGRGSVELQASIARPTPEDRPIVERLLPTQVRVEHDHAHVDEQMFVTTPTIEPPEVAKRTDDGDPPPAHDHLHPHEHRHEHLTPVSPAPTTTQAATAPAPAESTGNNERLPAPIYNPPPDYPADARQARITGTTWLRVGVRRDGAVEFVAVLQSSGHASLDDAAAAAVRRWRFTPGRTGGNVSPMVVRLPIQFGD